jgi:hypothetical protein
MLETLFHIDSSTLPFQQQLKVAHNLLSLMANKCFSSFGQLINK